MTAGQPPHHRYSARTVLSIFLLALLQLLVQPAYADWQQAHADIMGTRIDVELFHDSATTAREGIDAVLREMRRIDSAMSPYIASSELSLLNEKASDQAVPVSAELLQLILRAHYYSDLTHGAFDITFASAGFLYDYRRSMRPNTRQLRETLPLINYRNLIIDESAHSIRYGKPGVRIDLGGIAKGHAVDNAIRLLQAMGIDNALVTAGGDSRMIGERWGRPWTIGVRDPRRAGEVVALMPLTNVAVSTSGDYERYFEADGVRYHHIIDPASGDSARELQSVTIIGPDATSTDALSTSVFVMGLTEGLELVNSLPDVDAILVDKHGTLHYSEGLQSVRNPDSGVKAPAQTHTR